MALTDNLVSYWKLEDTSDSVGSNTLTATDITYTTGKIENSAVFNGSSGKFVIANDASLRPAGSFTISLWAKFDSLGSDRTIFASYYQNPYPSGIHIRVGTNKANLIIGQNSSGYKYAAGAGNSTMSNNIWYNIVYVYTLNTGYKMYLNGVDDSLVMTGYLGGDGTSAPAYNAGSNNIRIGCVNMSGSDTEFHDGLIDEIGIWSRALSSTEVTALYNSGNGIQYPFPASGPANLKSYNTNLKANIKSINTNAIANVKSLNTNT